MQEHPDIPVGTPAPASNGGVPAEVAAAISRALSDELQSGNAVRIRKLGMWTPYVKGNGDQAVVFHPDTKLLNGLKDLDNKQPGESANTSTAVDIPFVDDKTRSESMSPPRNSSGPIDVSLIFDEVREEFGLETPELLSTSTEPAIPAASKAHVPSPELTADAVDIDVMEHPELEPEIIEDESELLFNRNREQLFHPPLTEPKRQLNRAAIIVTVIMAAILVYLFYVGGLFDGLLPQNMQYRQHPVSEISKVSNSLSMDITSVERQELEVKVFV
jgi:hypothetical protein